MKLFRFKNKDILKEINIKYKISNKIIFCLMNKNNIE